MRRLTHARVLLPTLALLILVALLLVAQQWRLLERGWFMVQEWRHTAEWRDRSIWLPDYHATVQARPIEGLSSDVSALTFDPDRRTLFTVTNKKPEVVELSLDGAIIRRVPLIGFGDPEAIEYISRDLYVITDERQQRLYRVHLDDGTDFVDAADSEQLSLGIGLNLSLIHI